MQQTDIEGLAHLDASSRRQAGSLTANNIRQAAAASVPTILRVVRRKYVKSAALDDKVASHPRKFALLGRATVAFPVATSFLRLRSLRKGYCFRAIPTYAFGSQSRFRSTCGRICDVVCVLSHTRSSC
jgi:hypothetical protein